MIRFALRVEQLDYRRLLDKAIISQDIFDDLMAGIGSRTGALTVRPRLDLSIDTDTLVRKVPFLAKLAPDRISVISKMLKPYVTIPSETVITKGETGSEMYFISSGCIQVELEDQNVQLGSGDIFGEIALLAEVPRTANVKSLGFCELLMLDRRDFIPFLNANKDLKAHIKAVAAERHVQ
jgi:CPA1 family monovalent cation:H+ antiporter